MRAECLGKNLEFEMGPFLRNERFRNESVFLIWVTTVEGGET